MVPKARITRMLELCGEFCPQILVACLDLHRQGLIGGRNAFHRVGDPRIVQQSSPSVAAIGYRAGSQSEPVQGRVQQNAGMIAREGPPGAIGAVHARRQTDDHQARARNRQMAAPAGSSSPAPAAEQNREMRRIAGNAGKRSQKWDSCVGRCITRRSHRKNGLRGSPRSPPSIALGLWTNPSASEPKPKLGCEPVRPHLQGKNPPHQPIFLLVVRAVQSLAAFNLRYAGRFARQDSTCPHRGKPAFKNCRF